MATLYVENVPDNLYKALRKRARSQRRSIAAEVIQLLQRVRQHLRSAGAETGGRLITADEKLVNAVGARLPVFWFGAA
jgi:plasmid stability protein